MEAAENKVVTGRLDVLTATRGIAAMLIIIFHFGLEVFPFSEAQRFFSKGNMAVSYFFTLSGFIMCYTYYSQSISLSAFIVKRLARLGPVYWLAIVLSLFAFADTTNLLQALCLNVLFLQSYIPGYALTINSPGWSLSVEVFFYLLFPFLLRIYKLQPKRFVQLAVFIYIISQIVHLYFVKYATGSDKLHEFIYYHPLGHLNSFLIGMAGYYFIDKPFPKKMLSILLLSAIIVLSLMWLPLSKHNGLLAPLFVFLIILLTKINVKFIKNAGLVWLGEVSYSLYILQMPVFVLLKDITDSYTHIPYTSFFFLYVITLIIVAGITYHVVELPAKQALVAINKAQKK